MNHRIAKIPRIVLYACHPAVLCQFHIYYGLPVVDFRSAHTLAVGRWPYTLPYYPSDASRPSIFSPDCTAFSSD